MNGSIGHSSVDFMLHPAGRVVVAQGSTRPEWLGPKSPAQ